MGKIHVKFSTLPRAERNMGRHHLWVVSQTLKLAHGTLGVLSGIRTPLLGQNKREHVKERDFSTNHAIKIC